jgi:hypothetical protein
MTDDDTFGLSFDLKFYVEHFRAGRGTAEFVNMSSVRKLTGPLDVEVFVEACRAVIKRQELMRAIVVPPVDGGESHLKILPEDALAVEVIDLTKIDEAEALARAKSIASERTWTPYAFDNTLLYRVFVIRLPGDETVAGIAAHHFLADAISFAIIWRDIAEAYRRIRAHEPPVPPLKFGYRDFVAERIAWDKDWRSSKHAGFWLKYMEAFKPEAQQAAAPEGPATETRPAIAFSAEERTALVQLARRERVTFFTVLLALFTGAIAKHAGGRNPPITAIVDQRTRGEYLDIVGFFVNPIPVPTDVSDDPSFRTLLQRAKRTCIDLMENPWIPAEVSTHIYKNRIAFHILDYVDTAMYTVKFEGITVAPFELEPPPTSGMTANTFVFMNTAEALTGDAVSQFTHLWGHHAALLNSMKEFAAEALKDPDGKVSALMN